MRFELSTLVDITATNARRGDDPFLIKQHQNYLTVIQTIGMRANPIVKLKPIIEEKIINNLGFGSVYTGKHKVWILNFEFESDWNHSLEFLNNDFNSVPFISELTESVPFPIPAFNTVDEKYSNIIFQQLR